MSAMSSYGEFDLSRGYLVVNPDDPRETYTAFPPSALTRSRRADKPKRHDGEWVAVFDDALLKLANDNLSYGALRVLLGLLSRTATDGDEWEIRPQETAMKVRGVDAAKVSAAVTELVNHGYLMRTRRGYIKANPNLVWRGNATERAKAVGKWR